MEIKTQKAIKRLKEFELFCEDYESFKALFYENLKEYKSEEAMDLLLRSCFCFLKSNGEKFNEMFELQNEENKKKILSWLDDNLKRVKQ